MDETTTTPLAPEISHRVKYKPAGASSWRHLKNFSGADTAGEARRYAEHKAATNVNTAFRVVQALVLNTYPASGA